MSETHATPPGWSRYRPSKTAPWNARRIVHLYRRAGFGATWDQVQTALQVGCDESIDSLLDGNVRECRNDAKLPADWYQSTSQLLVESAIATQHMGRLKAAWIFRMLNSPDPLGEQLTLMWHNHFATSNLKIQDAQLMWTQNDLFRRLARQSFSEILRQVLLDPTMLIWLDADANTKRSPNENLARELLELFTLGIGHYSERDVKEAARALTGRTVRAGQGTDDPDAHDAGNKTILHETQPFTPDSLLAMLVAQPATARRVAWRICQHFLGEGVTADGRINSLAAGLAERRLDVRWAVNTVLRSEFFFSTEAMGRRISPPATYMMAAVRAVARQEFRPPPNILADWLAELGQDLFYPPNVGGWPGGPAWLSAQQMIARIRFAESLADGRLSSASAPQPIDLSRWRPAAINASNEDPQTIERTIEDLATLLLGCGMDPSHQKSLANRWMAAGDHHHLVSALLSLPEAQID